MKQKLYFTVTEKEVKRFSAVIKNHYETVLIICDRYEIDRDNYWFYIDDNCISGLPVTIIDENSIRFE